MASIPEFSDDMEIIQKLSDYPEQDMMSTSQFKACFDKAGILIKTFINKYIVPAINNYVASQDGLLKVTGGTMTGDIAMGGNKVTGLDAPADDGDAANKAYVDAIRTLAENALPKSGGAMTGNLGMGGNKVTGLDAPADDGDAANKAYVDGKRFTFTGTLVAGWWSDSAPYVQGVVIPSINESDMPHITPVYSTTNSTAIAQKEAWACVSKAVAGAGLITFTCFEDKPATEIPIQIEVNR